MRQRERAAAVLHKAAELVTRERAAAYGLVQDNHERIAALWEPVIGRRLTAREVVLCMVQLKVARLLHTPSHADSVVDIAGYAACYAECEEN